MIVKLFTVKVAPLLSMVDPLVVRVVIVLLSVAPGFILNPAVLPTVKVEELVKVAVDNNCMVAALIALLFKFKDPATDRVELALPLLPPRGLLVLF